MSPIHGVFPVDIAQDEECIVLWFSHDGDLVDAGVGPQTQISVHVVGVRGFARYMVRWYVKLIKAVIWLDQW